MEGEGGTSPTIEKEHRCGGSDHVRSSPTRKQSTDGGPGAAAGTAAGVTGTGSRSWCGIRGRRIGRGRAIAISFGAAIALSQVCLVYLGPLAGRWLNEYVPRDDEGQQRTDTSSGYYYKAAVAYTHRAPNASSITITNGTKTTSTAPATAIPLEEIVLSNRGPNAGVCPPGLVWVNDTRLPRNVTHGERLIPRVVHVTSKSRCMTPAFARNIDRWRFPHHSLYFHTDDDVYRLFRSRNWSVVDDEELGGELFPGLDDALLCVTSGATLSDLWRYLVLWEYGGIYTDVDNTPQRFNGSSIDPHEDDGFYVLEALGIIGQYFLASSPKHPYMKYTLVDAVEKLRETPNVINNKAPYTTGPHAVKMGLIRFMDEVAPEGEPPSNGYVPAGRYVGVGNRSVTVVGDKKRSQEWIHRGGMKPAQKNGYYKAANITHFSGTGAYMAVDRVTGKRIGCEEHIARVHEMFRDNGTSLADVVARAGPSWRPPRVERMYQIVGMKTKKPVDLPFST